MYGQGCWGDLGVGVIDTEVVLEVLENVGQQEHGNVRRSQEHISIYWATQRNLHRKLKSARGEEENYDLGHRLQKKGREEGSG